MAGIVIRRAAKQYSCLIRAADTFNVTATSLQKLLPINKRRRSRRGFTLVIIAVCSTVLLAMVGLTLDLGRAYVVKTELQAYVDAAAIAAALQLDGTYAGLLRADAVAATGPVTGGARPNRYDFATKPIASVTAVYSTTYSGAYLSSASAPVNSRFVKIFATVNDPVYFLPVLHNVSSSWSLGSTAIAGQSLQASIGEGMAPFSPDAHNPADPNFGFTVGQQYTLKWPPPGKRGKAGNTCGGDAAFTPPNTSSDRGYIDVGQGNGNSALHNAIVNNQFYLNQPYTVGSAINWVPGNKNVGPGIDERFNQDTDTASATFSSYAGNGRRIFVVPVNNDADPALVAGFAAFFMPPGMCGPKNTSPCCGEYIGPAVIDSTHKGAGGGSNGGGSAAGMFAVKLFH